MVKKNVCYRKYFIRDFRKVSKRPTKAHKHRNIRKNQLQNMYRTVKAILR